MGEKLAGTKPGRTLEVIVRKETPPLGTHLFPRAMSNRKVERTHICNSGGVGRGASLEMDAAAKSDLNLLALLILFYCCKLNAKMCPPFQVIFLLSRR